MEQTIKKHWYQNKGLLILLLFLFPPIAIYGMYKRDTKKWKKIVFIVFGAWASFVFFLIFIAILYPVDYYDNGIEFLKMKDNKTAISAFKKVEKNDINYLNALNKIDSLENLVVKTQKDSLIKQQEQQKEKAKLNALEIKRLKDITEFQKNWTDSILTNEKKLGKFIIGKELGLPNKINFELGKDATKNINTNKKQTLPYYQSDYNKQLKKHFKNSYSIQKTEIDFIPNKELNAKFNTNEWIHPVILNEGLKIYSGNKYDKTYLGKLHCKYKDENRSIWDGNQFAVIKKDNGSLTEILMIEFKQYYWIKKTDTNYNSAKGISKCF